MKEIKPPRKSLLIYWITVIAVILLFNVFVEPMLSSVSIKEVDYNTFITMTEGKEIAEVEIASNQILFKDQEGNYYKTGPIEDPGLVDRLHENGVAFKSQIIQQASPVMTFILSWVLPMVIFFAVYRMLSKRMMDKMGGANSMMFGMGRSNAKVYVKSSEGIRFSDVAGEEEAKDGGNPFLGRGRRRGSQGEPAGDRRISA